MTSNGGVPSRHNGVVPFGLKQVVGTAGVVGIICGETFGGLVTPEWGVGPFSIWFVTGLALLLVHQILWPSPRFSSCLKKPRCSSEVWQVHGVAIASRFLIMLVGGLAFAWWGSAEVPEPFRVASDWKVNLVARFDAGWYLGIARNGYRWTDDLSGHRSAIAFFPAYPIGMRVAGDLLTVPVKVVGHFVSIGNGNSRMLWGGTILSIVCFMSASWRLYRLSMIFSASRDVAWRAITLFAAYPFALFFSAPYSEGLFVWAALGWLLSTLENKPIAGFWWGLLTGLTRSNGWLLSVASSLSLVIRPGKDDRAQWIPAIAPLLGATAYAVYVGYLTGNPLEWITAQQGWGRTVSPVSFITRRLALLSTLGPVAYLVADPVDVLTFAATLLALSVAFAYLRQKEWLLGLWTLFYILPAIAIDLPALGRMTAVTVPIFTFLGSRLKGQSYVVVLLVFGICQVVLAARFFRWLPPF